MKFEGKFTIEKFEAYMDECKRLEIEYESVRRIPVYLFWKQNQILNKMSKLNNDYEEWLNTIT